MSYVDLRERINHYRGGHESTVFDSRPRASNKTQETPTTELQHPEDCPEFMSFRQIMGGNIFGCHWDLRRSENILQHRANRRTPSNAAVLKQEGFSQTATPSNRLLSLRNASPGQDRFFRLEEIFRGHGRISGSP